MTQDEIIEIARQAGLFTHKEVQPEIVAFAKLVAEAEHKEMQGRIEVLYALYEQVCRQRDELMDVQRSMVEALRGRIQ